MSSPDLGETRQKLVDNRKTLKTFLGTLSPEQWDTLVYSEGEQWSVADLLRHLNQGEYGMIRLMEDIRQGGEGASADFDLNRWNSSGVRKSRDKTPAELLEALDSNREYLWQFMESLSAEDLAKEGRHGSGRILTIAAIIEVIAGHDMRHLADIRQALV
jgi:hypothetical protein